MKILFMALLFSAPSSRVRIALTVGILFHEFHESSQTMNVPSWNSWVLCYSTILTRLSSLPSEATTAGVFHVNERPSLVVIEMV